MGMGIAEFYSASPFEWFAALSGWQSANMNPDDEVPEAPSDDRIDEMLRLWEERQPHGLN